MQNCPNRTMDPSIYGLIHLSFPLGSGDDIVVDRTCDQNQLCEWE